MADYKLGYFGMVVAVHWELLIRGELYPVHDLREIASADDEDNQGVVIMRVLVLLTSMMTVTVLMVAMTMVQIMMQGLILCWR